MPPWPARLLNGSSSSSTPTRNPTHEHVASRERPLPRPPPDLLAVADRSSQYSPNNHRAQPSPPRPQTSAGRNAHARSVSHPLPKLFGRKKSTGNLNGYADTDVPLDDTLVPVLDGPPAPTPTRVISGKNKQLDDDGKATRNCMCCDSKVKVPRELKRFRCMCCLTINDLEPSNPAAQEEKDSRVGNRRAETYPGLPQGIKVLPLSVERTRAIIDQCLMTYLETRCHKQDENTAKPKADSPQRTPEIEESKTLFNGYSDEKEVAPMASPPDSPRSIEVEPPSATIRDFTDFDPFAYVHREDTPPPATSKPAGQSLSPSRPHLQRKPLPERPGRKPPPPPMNIADRTRSQCLPADRKMTPPAQLSPRAQFSPRETPEETSRRRRYERIKNIFRPLEDYMVASFGNYDCLNRAFSTARPQPAGRARSESAVRTPPPEPSAGYLPTAGDPMSELDAKMLLVGDFAENGSWWTGRLDRNKSSTAASRKAVTSSSKKAVTSKTPHIDWHELERWYDEIHCAGEQWKEKLELIKMGMPGASSDDIEGPSNLQEIEDDVADARDHTIRALLKVTENILKRPTRPLKEPGDLRFLLIILSNPSLYPSRANRERAESDAVRRLNRSFSGRETNGNAPPSPGQKKTLGPPNREGGQHTGILKRVFGLLANSSDTCHRYLIGWFSKLSEEHFVKTVDLVGSFVNHRLARRTGRPRSKSNKNDGGLIPDLSGTARNTSSQLHSALGLSGGSAKKRNDEPDQENDYSSDWQVKAAAKLMSLLFAANNNWQGKARDDHFARLDSGLAGSGVPASQKARTSGQLIHTSSFYNTLLDYHDMIADFKVWESKRDKFAFCQFPMFLSMGAKIKILEYDARRQMEVKAREAYFDQVIRARQNDGYFHLRVRRDCMVDDSLRQISEAVGAGQEELKKGLRVHFTGEEGVDAGGLRKEWFLMLVRDIFDPNHGMFVYDNDSHTCYFNPNSFETSDQYYLVGALLGLAIYNSTILDIALPSFAFRKLLAAAPSSATASNLSTLTGTKGQMTYTIADLAEFRPSLAAGLKQLLEFDGDVESTYCRNFVAPVERFGIVNEVPLMSNGEGTPVTNVNRQDFVDLYVRYLLDGAVTRQFEPFKRGFFTVCAGNALSLFRAEEIELLVRGSDETLDVDSLRGVAIYENWRHFQEPHQLLPNPSETVPVIRWFWDFFARADPAAQRKLLVFITGSDRIPAVGATSLVLKIVAGGDGWGGGGMEERARFPVARTCFNMLVLWRYDTREALEHKLWRAVEESEGFGLK